MAQCFCGGPPRLDKQWLTSTFPSRATGVAVIRRKTEAAAKARSRRIYPSLVITTGVKTEDHSIGSLIPTRNLLITPLPLRRRLTGPTPTVVLTDRTRPVSMLKTGYLSH